MPTSTKDGRRLTGYRGDTETGIQHQSLYDDDMEDYQHYQHGDMEDDDDEDDTGSELSIPDPNIDFDLVYALHTFAATVEGQASVVRGDALTLLDDSNSYWWLVKVLKTAEVGYIPAENIETPYERLARLNSHRNIELTRRDIQDAFPAPPSNNKTKNGKPKKTKRVTLAKGVQFQSQIIFGGNSSDSEDDTFEAAFEQWDERMRSDSSDDSDDSEDSEDPYNYYDGQQSFSEQQQPQPPQHQQNYSMDMYTPYNDNRQSVDPVDYYNDDRHSRDSDILNDQELSNRNNNRDTMNLEDETIKISLTPSIARDEHNNRASDSSIQSKLKKAAKLEKLLGTASPEPVNGQRRGSKDSNNSKDKKSGIRKFFSRGSSSSSDKEKGKKKGKGDRRSSGGSQYETASISSQSTGVVSLVDRDRSGSLDSTLQQQQQQQPTHLKIHAGNISQFINSSGMVESYKFVPVYPTTTATELIHLALQDQEQQLQDQYTTYHDYYLVVRTVGGDELTLVPSDKPLEIYHSLNTHLSTPMPSLKKARRISQLMGSSVSGGDNGTHIGGPNKDTAQTEGEVQFYLLSKTKRIEDGEIQIKVSLFPTPLQQEQGELTKRVDKLVKIPSSILIKDAVTLLLEKFHILNGVVANNTTDDNIKSLRLEASSEEDIVKYHLALNEDGQEHLLDLDEKLLNVFRDDQMPPIHYRRSSNPDRTSITVNITPPEKNELFFILKCVESRKKKEVVVPHKPEEEEETQTNEHRKSNIYRDQKKKRG
ncbi:unnamed protein product [Mucor hiemalis]